MTNSEKDTLSAEIGNTLPLSEQQYDERAEYNTTGKIVKSFKNGGKQSDYHDIAKNSK